MGVIKGEKLIQEIRISCRSIGGLSDEDDYRPGFLNPGITDILDSIILYSGGDCLVHCRIFSNIPGCTF